MQLARGYGVRWNTVAIYIKLLCMHDAVACNNVINFSDVQY